MAELMEGLRSRDEHMRGQPTAFTLRLEYALPESYVKIAGMMGMNLKKRNSWPNFSATLRSLREETERR
jgi:hypothetical protein